MKFSRVNKKIYCVVANDHTSQKRILFRKCISINVILRPIAISYYADSRWQE
jgi:hypothetical protein